MKIHEITIRVCDDCINLFGTSCVNPDCAFYGCDMATIRRLNISLNVKTDGQIGYEAYCKSYDQPLPLWHRLKPDVQKAWEDAAKAVRNAEPSAPSTEAERKSVAMQNMKT